MYVQTTLACKETFKKKMICFKVKNFYPIDELKPINTDVFINWSESIIKNTIYDIDCYNKIIGSKKKYFVCC